MPGKPGRPRKHPIPTEPKRPRGRPRKTPPAPAEETAPLPDPAAPAETPAAVVDIRSARGQVIPGGEDFQFRKGSSGNPAGKARASDTAAKKALEEIRKLTPQAVEAMKSILTNEKCSVYARIQVINMILERTYGKPDTALKVETTHRSVAESSAMLHAIAEQIRARKGGAG